MTGDGDGGVTAEIVAVRADAPEAVRCLAAYAAELAARFAHGTEPVETTASDVEDMVPPRGQFLLVMVKGTARGCAGLRTIGPGVGEVKRMWIDPEVRGRGLARMLLGELEAWARELGMHTVRLDTAAVRDEAIALYGSAGYDRIGPYNDNPHAAHWFEKRLSEPD